jgi:hypothetical protein
MQDGTVKLSSASSEQCFQFTVVRDEGITCPANSLVTVEASALEMAVDHYLEYRFATHFVTQ